MCNKSRRFNINYGISTPSWIYAVLLLVTIIIMIHGFQANCEPTKNIGYSLLASFIAAIIIDIGNTHVHIKAEQNQLNIITAEFRYDILGMRAAVVRAYEIRFFSDDSKRTFQQWLELSLDTDFRDEEITSEEYDDTTWEIKNQIGKILKSSLELQERLMDHISISIISEEDRRLLTYQ